MDFTVILWYSSPMNTKTTQTTEDASLLSRDEISLAVYHIGRRTNTSRSYTLAFIEEVLVRAARMLSKPITPVKTTTDTVIVEKSAEDKLRDDWSNIVMRVTETYMDEAGNIVEGHPPFFANVSDVRFTDTTLREREQDGLSSCARLEKMYPSSRKTIE